MRCRQCGRANRDEARFCFQCGAKLEPRCPTCDSPLPGGALFCDQCGRELRTLPAQVKESGPAHPSLPAARPSSDLLTRRSQEGERKQVTVLFADVSGFTGIAERLDPEDVHALINRCFALISGEVSRYEGTITQLSGDGVMALFGAPIAQEDHALRAVYAAWGIQRVLKGIGEGLRREPEIALQVRIGLNSGLVVVGGVGSGLDREYTALGDTVNVAARLQAMTEPGSVMISGETRQLVEGFFELKSLGALEIRGRRQPATAYLVVGTKGRQSRLSVARARGLTPFVGRRRDLELLRDGLEKTRTGQGQVICLVGEAGLGKSRLIHELRASLDSDPSAWLESSCVSFGRDIPYLPILDMIKGYYGLDEIGSPKKMAERLETSIRELGPALEWTLPFVLHLLSLNDDSGGPWAEMDPRWLKRKSHEALRTLIGRKSQLGPLVWVVEDLHWIDALSEELLASLVEAMAGSALLFLLTYRPGYSPPWGGKSYGMQIALNRLSPRETAGMAGSLLGTNHLSEELRDFLSSRAEGNPFFVEELTRSLVEAGAIVRSEGKDLGQDGLRERMGLPRTIQGVIMERIDRLTERQKKTLQVAAVIGREFSLELLQAVLEAEEREIERHLQELVRSEFIYQRVYWPDPIFRFRHVLIQEVAYAGLLLQRRKTYHGKVGQHLESLFRGKVEERCEELARHYWLGENPQKALDYWTLAGSKAGRIYAVPEAIGYFEAALRALDALPPGRARSERRVDVDMKYAFMLSLAGRIEEALSVLKDAERVAEEVGDRGRLMQVCSRITPILFWKGGTWEMTSFYQQKAFQLAEELGHTEGMAAGYEGLGLLYSVHDSERAIDCYRRALQMREEQGDKAKIAACWRDLAWTYCTAGAWKEAIFSAQRALELGEELGDRRRMGWSSWILGLTYGSMGQWEKGVSHSQRGLELCREIGDAYGEAMSYWGLAWSYLESGEWPKAEEASQAAIAKAQDAESSIGVFAGYASLTEAYLGQGKVELAHESSHQAGEIAQRLGFNRLKGWSICLQGIVLTRRGPAERESAESFLRQGLDLLREAGATAQVARYLHSLGLFYWETGALLRGRDFLSQAIDLHQKLETEGDLRRARRDLERLEAALQNQG